MPFRFHSTGRVAVTAVLAALLGACGGGGGGSASNSPAPTTNQAVTAQGAAMAGEYVTFTIDASRTHYSYTIQDSAYGLNGITRSGTLIANADGTYTPSLDTNARVAFLPSGLVLAAVRENFNGLTRTVGFLGVQNPIASIAATAGIFNFVEYACFAASGCGVAAGTFALDGNGGWSSCPGADYAPACPNQQMGTLNSLGNGRFDVLKGGVSIGNAIAYVAPNGQKVVILDLKDSTAAGLGRGILVGSQQRALVPGDVAGTYVSMSTAGAAAVVTVNTGLTYSSSAGASGRLQLNQPFSGFVAVNPAGGGVSDAILAGKGLYGLVGTVNGGPYAEIGIGL